MENLSAEFKNGCERHLKSDGEIFDNMFWLIGQIQSGAMNDTQEIKTFIEENVKSTAIDKCGIEAYERAIAHIDDASLKDGDPANITRSDIEQKIIEVTSPKLPIQ